MQVDAGEVVLFDDPQVVGDTFIFEPARAEEKLGRLLAAVEVADREGVGRELIDTIMHALQREYYREPPRGMLASFESALHQANLVLHDLAEQGVREWMGSLHVAAGVLGHTMLHVSTSGHGVILLARRSRLVTLSAGLSHSPITDPLRAFAQVASGSIGSRDVLFFGTTHLENIFRAEDLLRFVLDHSAGTIALRLKQLYEDRHINLPVAALVVSLLPQHAVSPSQRQPTPRPSRAPVPAGPLALRRPLTIRRSLVWRLMLLAGRLAGHAWRHSRRVVWPLVKEGSRRSGQALYSVSRQAGYNVRTLTSRTAPMMQGLGRRLVFGSRSTVSALPRSSKIFAVLAVVLALALVISLGLLQKKRAADEQIQWASELLHEARTKKEAAETALIYDNRDQARTLLKEAEDLVAQISAQNLYQEQTRALHEGITVVQDRLARVARVSPEAWRTIGDFSQAASQADLGRLFVLNDALYTYDLRNNAILKMTLNGEASVASQTTQGIGFFTSGTTHEADKSLVLVTDSPGIAVFDAKNNLVQQQEIVFPSDKPDISGVATYGNRLYVLDRAVKNIFGYSKTLRGYSGGDAWITAEGFLTETITSLGVDGYMYTMHDDGTVRKLLKGEPVEFTLETTDPPLPASSRLIINEDLSHLYIFDVAHQRVAVFDTVGNLNRQIYLGELAALRDVAIDAQEMVLFVLDGTRVQALSLQD